VRKAFVTLALLALAGLGLAQKCETNRTIVFADYDWESARVHNRIAQFILEKGYGCKTDALPGTSIPLITGLGRGDIDVSMEIWYNLSRDIIDRLESEGKIQRIGVNFPDAVQGWFVPTYVIKGDEKRGIKPMAPDLKSVFDLPKYKDLFRDPEEPTKGRFYNGVLGWFAEKVNTKKLKAYGLDKHYQLPPRHRRRPGGGHRLRLRAGPAHPLLLLGAHLGFGQVRLHHAGGAALRPRGVERAH